MKLLTPKDLAEKLQISIKTLRRWRYEKKVGPAWIKLGTQVRYPESEVEKYLESLEKITPKGREVDKEEDKAVKDAEDFDYWV